MIDTIMTLRGVNLLGRLGENEHRRMLFPIAEYTEMYPGAAYALIYHPPGATEGYPVATTSHDERYLYWIVTNTDLAAEGSGLCELIVLVDSVVAKSDIYETRVLYALDGAGTPPPPWEGWQAEFARIKGEAEDAAEAAEDSATAALGSAQTATDASGAAVSARDAAQGYASDADGYARDAAGSATQAGQSAEAAGQSAEDAQEAAEGAAGSATQAGQSTANAASSAASASADAAAAAEARADAQADAAAASESADNARDAAQAAEESASTAAGAAASAAASEGNAAGSASAAAQSATNAAGSASGAANSATAAAQSASAAAASATAAAASEAAAREAAAASRADYTELAGEVSDLAGEVADKYEKPATGIPATDLAPGVIPAVPVQDVQVNGTSILQDGVANVPVASDSVNGVVKVGAGLFVQPAGSSAAGQLTIYKAGENEVKAGTQNYKPIVPQRQHLSTFYGLAKAAGSDEKDSTLPVGQYTEAAKSAIRKMLGIPNQEWEKIGEYTVTENSVLYEITTDSNGQPFSLSQMLVKIWVEASTTGTRDYISAYNLAIRNDDVNTVVSAPTKRYLANTGAACYFQFESWVKGGSVISNGIAASAPESTQTLEQINYASDNIKSFRGFRLSQYASTQTLIPAGTVIKLYGIRID